MMVERSSTRPLAGKVAVVAGATRGAGRGIAVALGAAGATVYCSGRSTRGKLASGPRRTETIDETAELVSAQGGNGIAVRTDHTVEEDVRALFERVQQEQGKLDVLVNDVWGGDELIDWNAPFWEQAPSRAHTLLERSVYSHLLTSRYGVPMMVKQRSGLVIEITDGDKLWYRGQLLYDLIKTSIIRLAYGMAEELHPHNVTVVAVTPGFLRSEAMLELFGVTEATWREGARKDPHFIASETPAFVGRAVAALASDPGVHEKSGSALASWTLNDEYGFTDADGSRPHWGRHYDQHFDGPPFPLRTGWTWEMHKSPRARTSP